MGGQAYMWGSNAFSQLGLMIGEEVSTPTPVLQLQNVGFLALGAFTRP